MARSKFTVNLGNLQPGSKEYRQIMDAVHKLVNKHVKAPAQKKKPRKSLTEGTVTTQTATITIAVTNTEPGMTDITVKHGNKQQKATESATLIFPQVQAGDLIFISGKSLGNTAFTIDIPAKPSQKKFEPGTFRFFFRIL